MIPYILKSFRGGISDESGKGIAGSFKFGYGLDIHKRRDSLSCLYAMQTISTSSSVTDLVKFAVTGHDGTTVCFGSNGSVYTIAGHSSDPVISHKYSNSNGGALGAADWEHSDGNYYVYWATATSLARKLLPGDDAWGDVSKDYKTTLESTDWHVMRNAAGKLRIANGNYLGYIDFEGNYDGGALNLRPGNLIKTLEERDDYVIMGSERLDEGEEGHLWNWIETAANWVQKKKIPVKGINAIIDTELLLMQGGTDGEIFYSDFTNTAPINAVPDGGYVNPGGVTIYDDRAMFGFFGGSANPGIYSYGRKAVNRPFTFSYDYRLAKTVSGSTVAEIGAVWTAHGSLFASWKTTDGSTTEYGIDMVSSTTRASARYEGLEFDGQAPHLAKQFTSLKVIMEPLGTSCSVSLPYKSNRGDWRYANIAGSSSTSYSTQNSTEAEFVINDKFRVVEVGTELTPSGDYTPEVTALVGYIADQTRGH